MTRLLFSGFFLLLSSALFGQNEHFEWLGLDAMPLPGDSIDALPYSGEANDFSGGYALGDTVGDFHLWTLNGEEFVLSNEVEAGKPTILFNGSATCVRFQNDWNPTLSPAVFDWVMEHLDDFNWVPIYVAEAHALDTENCPSNCPDLPIPGPHGQYLYQHRIMQDRMDAAQIVMDFMGPQSGNEWLFPFDDILIDSPDNLIYSHYFMRPAGLVVIDCNGVVVARGDWFGTHLNNAENQAFLEDLLEAPAAVDPECLLIAEVDEPCGENVTDSDGDGTCDEAELLLGTDPFNPCDLGEEGMGDADGDGACDALEALTGTDPNNPCDPLGLDTDGDGFCDVEEELMGSNPNNACSPSANDLDQDGYCDSEEAAMGSDPADPCSPDGTDSDNDGLCNSQELANGSDPNNSCDPYGEDSDGDGLCDQIETIIGSSSDNPCDPYGQDVDGDGFCDLLEGQEGWGVEDPCSPNDLDVDGDGWCAGAELANGWNDMSACDPISTDSDGDGWCDMEEAILGSDPDDPCSPDATDTDGDGWCDQLEVISGSSPTNAESTLDADDVDDAPLSLWVTEEGFQVSCTQCLGQAWVLLDAAGRTVHTGRLDAVNALSAPEGLYLLSLPESGWVQRLVVPSAR